MNGNRPWPDDGTDRGTGEGRYVPPTIDTARVRRTKAPNEDGRPFALARSKLATIGTSRVTRRRFLKGTAGAVGGVALALYVTPGITTLRAGSVDAPGTPCPTSPTTSDPDQPKPSPCTTTSDNPSPEDTK